MISILIDSNFSPERRYITDIVFGEFFGLDYQVISQEGREGYEIIIENGNRLIVEDHFFKNFHEGTDYLREDNIPDKIRFVKNQFLSEKDIPVIFGNDRLVVSQDSIICGIDIFASMFFMLTRWEEYVNKTRDKHNRFPAYASLTHRNGFLGRPVVNEYTEMLWNVLLKLGIQQGRKERKFEMLLTHDVDTISKYNGILSGCRRIIDNFINKANPVSGFKRDPFDTFDYLMDTSEKAGLRSYFFFMDEGASTGSIKNTVRKIRKRGHNVGFHAGYDSYNDTLEFAKEKTKIEDASGVRLKYGRQHFLRFESSATWQVWEANNMEWDSTLCYADKEGFRCGTCYEYSVFNFLTRERLKLKEKPLIAMDGSFVHYQPGIGPEEMESKIRYLIDKCKKYNGTFVLLWHNSSFGTRLWKPFENVYGNIIKKS